MVLTNSWVLYQELHERRGPGFGSYESRASGTLGERLKTSDGWAKWVPGLCAAVGRAIRSWIGSTQSEREEEEKDGKAVLRALTAKEMEFRRHCEEGHIVFRRDCKACLKGQMRSHVHRRQKHHGSNTFCLSMDLVGPWKPGKDHLLGQPATRFLIASLTVPRPGSVGGEPMEEDEANVEGTGEENGDSREREARDEGEIADYEIGEVQDGELEDDPNPEEVSRRARQAEEAWRREAAKLQDPVPTHDLIFCEPLSSKKSSEVLRAIQ